MKTICEIKEDLINKGFPDNQSTNAKAIQIYYNDFGPRGSMVAMDETFVEKNCRWLKGKPKKKKKKKKQKKLK